MIEILVICLFMSLISLVSTFLESLIVYKKRIKTYKNIVEKYDLNVELPKTFKEWYYFNIKMIEYQKNNDITDYLFYLSSINENLQEE